MTCLLPPRKLPQSPTRRRRPPGIATCTFCFSCSIAEHIVLGQGFSSPFYQDTGPTAWVAPVYPYLAALVFRLFGLFSGLRDRAPWHSVHYRRRNGNRHSCAGPPHAGCADRILRGVDLGAQPHFFSLAGFLR